MRYSRITITHLTLVVLAAAIGLAAIRNGTAAWAGAMFSITFFAMICSLLGVALGRGPRRVYWSGFAALGWSYLFLIYVPWLHREVGQHLLAPNLFAHLEEVLHPASGGGGGFQSVPVGILGATATGGGFSGPASVGDHSDFVRIGLTIEALLWAFLGGWAARYFASGREPSIAPGVASPRGASGGGRQGDEAGPAGSIASEP